MEKHALGAGEHVEREVVVVEIPAAGESGTGHRHGYKSEVVRGLCVKGNSDVPREQLCWGKAELQRCSSKCKGKPELNTGESTK